MNDNDIDMMRLIMSNMNRCSKVMLSDIYGALNVHKFSYVTEFNIDRERESFKYFIIDYFIYLKSKLKYSKEINKSVQDFVNKILK
jgi:hypothetical protein